jgi:transcriptional regulator GlxA family with amidase domain
MHFVIYLPEFFYAAVASSIAEVLEAVNDLSGKSVVSHEFISKRSSCISRSGIRFRATREPTKAMDVLILLAGMQPSEAETVRLLERDAREVRPLIEQARMQDARIAATCGASYFLADSGYLDHKRATGPWWMVDLLRKRFPRVRWEPQRMIIRQGSIYSTGAAFAGLDLISKLLIDVGLLREERQVRKVLLLPPLRQFQTPYEIAQSVVENEFETRLEAAVANNLKSVDILTLSRRLGMSQRTLARRFHAELGTTPAAWVRSRKLAVARDLLETSNLSVSHVCRSVGYEDVASFVQAFSKNVGMSPLEFRRELRGASKSTRSKSIGIAERVSTSKSH